MEVFSLRNEIVGERHLTVLRTEGYEGPTSVGVISSVAFEKSMGKSVDECIMILLLDSDANVGLKSFVLCG